MSNFITDKDYSKILKILKEKGYEVVLPTELGDRSPDLELYVSGYWGYGCGTGLTFKDYLKVPASYSVHLSVPKGNIVYKDYESFSRPVVMGIKPQARKRLLKSVQGIPVCE